MSHPGQKKNRNGGTCLICNTTIESKHRHDFVTCECGAFSVDGGNDYHRFLFKDDASLNQFLPLDGDGKTMAQLHEEAPREIKRDLKLFDQLVKLFEVGDMSICPVEWIKPLLKSKIPNYVLPGLESYLVDGHPECRVFHATRVAFSAPIPHSHRSDLRCLVLKGCAVHHVFTPDEKGDLYSTRKMRYNGRPGNYQDDIIVEYAAPLGSKTDAYLEGDSYSLTYDQIHTVTFSRDSYILIEEGEHKTEWTQYLLPVVDGRVIGEMTVEPWMFKS